MNEALMLPSIAGPDEPERPYRIAIATPVWADVSWRFLNSWGYLIADVMGRDGQWAEWMAQVSAGSLLPTNRNDIVNRLAGFEVDLTHVVMVDSDVIGLTGKHIKRMVDHDQPIVSALVNLRERDCRPACEADDNFKALYDELEKDEPGIVPRRWVGTGCICIKWGVLEDMAIEYEDPSSRMKKQWFRCHNVERASWKRDWQEAVDEGVRRTADLMDSEGEEKAGALAEIFTEVWMRGRDIWNGGRQLGEDVEFGVRAGAKGYQSFIDCGIQLYHLGEREVGFQDHLDFLARKPEAG